MIVTFNHCRYFLLPYAVFVEYILNLQKSNLFHCFSESAFRGVGGFFCALLHAFREISLVAYKAVVFISQRTELVAYGFTDCGFKVAVALAVMPVSGWRSQQEQQHDLPLSPRLLDTGRQ